MDEPRYVGNGRSDGEVCPACGAAPHGDHGQGSPVYPPGRGPNVDPRLSVHNATTQRRRTRRARA